MHEPGPGTGDDAIGAALRTVLLDSAIGIPTVETFADQALAISSDLSEAEALEVGAMARRLVVDTMAEVFEKVGQAVRQEYGTTAEAEEG